MTTIKNLDSTYKELKWGLLGPSPWNPRWIWILPIRNWNKAERRQGTYTQKNLDSTYKELKFWLVHYVLVCFSHIWILPIRNWNFNLGSLSLKSLWIWILPIRNWNPPITIGTETLDLIWILPIRNWNLYPFSRKYWPFEFGFYL